MNSKSSKISFIEMLIFATILSLFTIIMHLKGYHNPYITSFKVSSVSTLILPFPISHWWDLTFALIWTPILTFIFTRPRIKNDYYLYQHIVERIIITMLISGAIYCFFLEKISFISSFWILFLSLYLMLWHADIHRDGRPEPYIFLAGALGFSISCGLFGGVVANIIHSSVFYLAIALIISVIKLKKLINLIGPMKKLRLNPDE